MCEDEGTKGGDGTAEAARCVVRREEVPVVLVGGGGQWMIKWLKAMRKMLGKAHLSLGGG